MSLARFSLVALISSAICAVALPSLSVEVTGPPRIDDVDNLRVTATLTNSGDETVKILKDPRSILSEHPAYKFTVSNAEGSQPPFGGIQFKYVPEVAAKAGGYVSLPPGQSITATHDLAGVYNFNTSGSGLYKLKAHDIFHVVDEDNVVTTLQATDNVYHEVHISGKLESSHLRRSDLSRRLDFINCTASQQNSVKAAAASAQTYAANANSYLVNNKAGTARYTAWFGSYVASRRDVVAAHFRAINTNDFSGFTYDCSCTDANMFAFVYPPNLGHIHLCGAFWSAPTTGTDSKAGTIIHESSHFLANGGTSDVTYGQSAARNLATTNPASAIMNADSHEYFAENNPTLS